MKWHIFDAVAKWPSFCATVYTVQQKIQTKKHNSKSLDMNELQRSLSSSVF